MAWHPHRRAARRYRITLLFNANKAYDRQVMEGVGEYLQASQSRWDIFIEDDFCLRSAPSTDWLGDGVIADYDDADIEAQLAGAAVPVVGVGGSRLHSPYPPVHYIATDNAAQVELAWRHLQEKGISQFAFYGLPDSIHHRWAKEREMAFRRLASRNGYPLRVYQGSETSAVSWQHAQNRLADWLQQLPPHCGIIAVTDSRARHILQACESLNIPVPETLSVIGIDNEELTRYLSRVSLSSVVQGTRQMGFQAARLLQRLIDGEVLPMQRMLIPPQRVIGRRSTDYRSLNDPAVIQAMHFIRGHASNGIRVEQVLDAVGLSRTSLDTRFKAETGHSLHATIHAEKLTRAREMLTATALPVAEIAQVCGYPSLPYFYAVFRKAYGIPPGQYREDNRHGTPE